MADTVRTGDGGDDDVAPPRRRLGTLAAVVVVLLAVVLSARAAGRATVDDVLQIPDLGTVRADRLANGTPVFVVSTPAADPGGPQVLDVIQAFTPEIDGPVTALVGWCADAASFVDPHHGPLYDVRGRRLPSSLSGRELTALTVGARHTALDDLIHRVVAPATGRTAPDDPFVVEGIQRLQPWQVEERPAQAPSVPPAQCRRPADPPGAAPTHDPVAGLVDHSFLAAPVDPSAAGWQVTTGWLVVGVDGVGTWCDVEPTPLPRPTCPSARPDVPVGFRVPPEDVGEVPAVVGGPLAVRLSEGRVARAAVLPDSTWRGSSLRGTEAYVGELVRSWTDEDPSIGVRGVQGGGEGLCLDAFPGVLTDRAVASRIAVSATTTFDVAGITDPSGIDQLPLHEGIAVRIVVDAATCEALSVLER